MPNKRLERWYLEQLKSELPDFPTGEVEPGESPDFVVREPEGSVGIEITVFHRAPAHGERPHQELQSLKDGVVDLARRMHHESGGPALYVTVFFHEPIAFNKRSAQSVAAAIAGAVSQTAVPSSIGDGSRSVAWDHLPDGVVAITIYASVDGADRLWSADAGGWVAPVTANEIDVVLRGKQSMLTIARTKCRRVWLVVVNDVFSRAAPVELSDEARHHLYPYGFNRVFWLDAHAPAITELKRAG
ncbi:MAG: hypothetical protein R2712_05885 [Vicinamibacterales bacterium]